jgi:hypothetical protein
LDKSDQEETVGHSVEQLVLGSERESVSNALVTLEVVVNRVGEGMDLFFLESTVSIDSIVLLEVLLRHVSVFQFNGVDGFVTLGEVTLKLSIAVDVLEPRDLSILVGIKLLEHGSDLLLRNVIVSI